MSLRYTKLLPARALSKVEIPGGEQLKKLSLERLDALRMSLFTKFERATDDSVAATLARALVAVEQRTAALMRLDVPHQLAVQLALNPPTADDEMKVASLSQNLSVEELRQLVALTAKANGRAALTRTAHAVTPTTGRASNEVQPARPPAPAFDDEVPPPSPDWDEGLVQATEAPIIIPAPPRPAPRTPTLREVYDKQTGGYGAEIDRLVAERGIMCPDGPNDVNWASHCARIERIEKLRDLEVDPNAATTIQRG